MKIGYLFIPIIAVAIISCQTTELKPEAETVQIVSGISASDAQIYRENGFVSCMEYIPGSPAPAPEHWVESCRNKMRNEAAMKGLAVIVIESRTEKACKDIILNVSYPNCLTMKARGYTKVK